MAGLLLHALPQPLKLGIGLNGLFGEGVVEPPAHQRRHGGEAGGDELLQSAALDGQHGLAQSAQDLVDEGQSQHGGAGDGGSGDGAVGDMCVHSLIPFFFVFMIFQIGDAVIGHLHLLFQHGDSLGKVVVLPHLAGQLLKLGVRDSLTAAVGDKHADEGHGPGDEGGENGLHRSHPLHRLLFARVSICTQPVLRVGCFASFG